MLTAPLVITFDSIGIADDDDEEPDLDLLALSMPVMSLFRNIDLADSLL